MGLPSAHRMTRPGEFSAVRLSGRSRSGRLLTVAYLKQADVSGVRFGFTLTKRLGNAVKRNLLRRRLREIAREHSANVKGQGMIVTIPRPIAVKATFAEVREEWLSMVRKLGLLPVPQEPASDLLIP